MLHPGEKAVEDALIALVELIDSLQAMEDAKWAEVSLEAISRSEEFEAGRCGGVIAAVTGRQFIAKQQLENATFGVGIRAAEQCAMGERLKAARRRHFFLLALGSLLLAFLLWLSHRLEVDEPLEVLLETLTAMAFGAGVIWWTRRHVEKLNSIQAQKNALLSMLAHDLRSSISVIFGLSDLLRNNAHVWSGDQMHDLAQRIMSCSRKLLMFQENLLCWSRLDLGCSCVRTENVILRPLVDEQLSLLSDSAMTKDVALVNQVEPDVAVRADRRMVGLVLHNLLCNGVKFTEAGGWVVVRIEVQDAQVALVVEDTGVGMTDDQVARLFAKDETNSTPGTAGEGGFGLGLILCKQLIGLNSGEIHVETRPGEGSVFRVILPRGETVGERLEPSGASQMDAEIRQIQG